MEPQRKNSYILPIAILLGFGIIASVIFFSNQSTKQDPRTNVAQTRNAATPSMKQSVRTVTADDMIRGNPNAPLMFVTYLDYDCPTCKSYYYAMDRLVREQGIDGLVGWTFRPLPAGEDTTVLEAGYCAGTESDSDFWRYSDIVFDSRDTVKPVDQTKLAEYASTTGIAINEFNTCRSNNVPANTITTLATEAKAAGANQAPFTVVMLGDEQEALYGAQTYSTLNKIVNGIRTDLEQ